MKIVSMLSMAAVAALLAFQPLNAAVAASVESAVAEPTVVTIPFAPPLGQEMGYRMTRSQMRAGKPSDVAMNLYISFNQSSEGFEMRTRFEQIGNLAGSPVDQLLGRPIIFRLNGDGIITGVVDEESYWTLMDEAIDRFMPADMKKDLQSQQMLRRLITDMRNLPDEQRLALLAKNYQPLFEMIGAQFSVGESKEGSDEATLPFPSLGNLTLQRQIRLTLESANQETATFKLVTSIDPESMKTAFEGLMQLAPPEKRKPVPQMDVREEATYVVSTLTGLTERYQEIVEAVGQEEGEKRITKLTRVAN